MKQRVVFDTNVLLSALIFRHGRLSVLRQQWQTECTALASSDTLQELNAVLHYRKFGLTFEEVAHALSLYIPHAEIIENIQPAPITCRDSKDQKFLDLAHSAQASALVTGDEDLLVLTGQAEFKILTPSDYLAT